MGYTVTTPYSLLEFSNQMQNEITITNVDQDIDIRTIAIPEFRGSPDYAFVDILMMGRENTNVGAVNMTAAGMQWGIKDTGGTFRAGGTVDTACLYTPVATYIYGYHVFTGYSNVASYITSGGTQTFAFHNAQATQNNLKLYELTGKIRLYFAVR